MKLDLEELQALAERLEKLDKDGIGGRLSMLEQTMADVLDKLGDLAPAIGKAIAEALKDSITVNVPQAKAPEVTVNVPEIKLPQPAAAARPTELEITPKRSESGVAASYLVKVK